MGSSEQQNQKCIERLECRIKKLEAEQEAQRPSIANGGRYICDNANCTCGGIGHLRR